MKLRAYQNPVGEIIILTEKEVFQAKKVNWKEFKALILKWHGAEGYFMIQDIMEKTPK